MNIWKIIYLNCGERNEDMIDHRIYTHNLSSCEIKAWKKIGSCVICAPLNWCIGRHIDLHSTDVSVNISTDTQLICWSTYRLTLGRYIDRDMSVNILTDIAAETLAESWSMYWLTIGRYLGRYSARHSANTLTIDCWRNIDRLSLVCQSTDIY